MYRNNNGGNSDVIIQLSNNLSNQIQNIRKEISDNSEKSRLEIESKLHRADKELSTHRIRIYYLEPDRHVATPRHHQDDIFQ